MASSSPPRIFLQFSSLSALQASFREDLQHGRALLPFCTELEPLAHCILVLIHPLTGEEFPLDAQVVMQHHGQTGLQLAPTQPSDADSLARFVVEAAETPTDRQHSSPPQPSQGPTCASQGVSPTARLTSLAAHEQLRLARKGELTERVTLERLYGKGVWQALLQNPRITPPEVTRIARKGTVPRPLLEQIIDNPIWLNCAPIRRALLANPRVGKDGLMKLLRATPPGELKALPANTAYPAQVREMARRFL